MHLKLRPSFSLHAASSPVTKNMTQIRDNEPTSVTLRQEGFGVEENRDDFIGKF